MTIKKKSARPISAQEASIARGNFPAQAREYWSLLSPVARERIAAKLREPPSEPRDSFFVADAAPGGRDLLFPILTEIAKLARAGMRSGSESAAVKPGSVPEMRGRAAWAEWVQENPYYLKEPLPSENGGIPSYDDDFRAGFKAAAVLEAKAPNTADITRAQREFKKSGHKKHGSWWIDGFTVPIDVGRRAYATTPALIAARMGLYKPEATKAERVRERVAMLLRPPITAEEIRAEKYVAQLRQHTETELANVPNPTILDYVRAHESFVAKP